MEAQGKYPMADDELDVTAYTDRKHNPKGFRPHEILRVTAPMLEAVQRSQPEGQRSTNVKDAWLYICSKAGIEADPSWLDSRTLEVRQKDHQQEPAKADTGNVEIDRNVLANVKKLLGEGKTPDQVAFLMKAGHFSENHIKVYLEQASDNPFI